MRLAAAVLLLAVVATDGYAEERFGRADQTAHFPRERVTDVKHVRVDVRVDVRAGTVEGTSTIDLVLLREGQRVRLDAAQMTIVSVKAGPLDLHYRHEGEALFVDLPRGTPVGKPVQLQVRYEAKPRRGMYFVRPDDAYPDRPLQAWTQGEAEDNRYWFPSYDVPDDRFSTEVVATVRAPLTAVSNGRLLASKETPEGWRTVHWKQAEEHVNYLVTLVVGEFDRHVLDGHRVPMAVWVPRGTRGWERSFDKTADMMGFYESYLDFEYPWAKYDQVVVHDFLYGGMENTTASTLTSGTLHDERAALDWSSDGLVAHELVHQWFGDLITCRSWPHLWLNEGFATYFEGLYIEARKGKDEFDWDRLESTGWYLGQGYVRRMDERRFDHADDLFDGHTYVKGAWILHMLRRRLGDDAFRRAVRHYLRKHAQGVVESSDLRRAFEEATGAQLSEFFEQWVERAGHPRVDIAWHWDEEQKAVVIRARQSGKPFRVGIDVRIAGEKSARTYTIDLSRAVHDITLPVSAKPRFVEFDPGADVLAEVEVSEPATATIARLRGGSSAISRWRAARMLESTESAHHAAAAKALIASVGDAEEFRAVRAAAAGSLGTLGGHGAEEALLGALTARPSTVRRAATEALSSFDSERVVDALERTFESDRSYKAVAAAVRSWAALRPDKAWAIGKKALKRSSHREVVRSAAIGVLADVGTVKARKLIEKMTRYGQPTHARRSAASALGRMGASDDTHREAAREALVGLLKDPRFWVRNSAVQALASLGDPAAIGPLEALRARATTRRIARNVDEALQTLRAVTPPPEALQAEIERLRARIDALEKDKR